MYLSATSNSVDKSAPLDITLQRPSKVKRPTAQASSAITDDTSNNLEPSTKRSRLEDIQKSLLNRVSSTYAASLI